MHMCFALLVGVTALRIAKRRWVRVLALLYPLLVLAVIVVTANHFILDAVAGALTAVLAGVIAAKVMARARPPAWAWPRGAGPAPVPARAAAESERPSQSAG